jgi:DNA-binding transcriptional LysR family regulator
MNNRDTELRYAELVEHDGGPNTDWDDFRIFLEIIRYGSLNKAANKLRMTQPTVSRRLSRLEQAVGSRLFERDRRGPRLTFEGQRVYQQAIAAQLALTRAAAQQGLVRPNLVGDCKVLIGEALATYWVTKFISLFFDRHPNVDVKLFATNEVTAERRNACDLQVHYYEPTTQERGALRLGMLHFIPFASRDYLQRYGTPHSVDDLKNHRLLDQALHLSDVSNWVHWMRQKPVTRTSFFTNLSGSLAEAVRSGAGIAMMPTYGSAVTEDFIPVEIGIRYQTPLSLLVTRDAGHRWPVRAMAEFLRNTVFDSAAMPWFSTQYITPHVDWPLLLRSYIAAAEKVVPRQSM